MDDCQVMCARTRSARELSDKVYPMPLAMAYVRIQQWGNIYKTEHALCKGTIFAELDMPFVGKGACVK